MGLTEDWREAVKVLTLLRDTYPDLSLEFQVCIDGVVASMTGLPRPDLRCAHVWAALELGSNTLEDVVFTTGIPRVSAYRLLIELKETGFAVIREGDNGRLYYRAMPKS